MDRSLVHKEVPETLQSNVERSNRIRTKQHTLHVYNHLITIEYPLFVRRLCSLLK